MYIRQSFKYSLVWPGTFDAGNKLTMWKGGLLLEAFKYTKNKGLRDQKEGIISQSITTKAGKTAHSILKMVKTKNYGMVR